GHDACPLPCFHGAFCPRRASLSDCPAFLRRKGSEEREGKGAMGRRGVYAFFHANQVRAGGLKELLCDEGNVDFPAKTVKAKEKNAIEFPLPGIFHESIACLSLLKVNSTAHTLVLIDCPKFQPLPLAPCPGLVNLRLDGFTFFLLVRADSRIEHGL